VSEKVGPFVLHLQLWALIVYCQPIALDLINIVRDDNAAQSNSRSRNAERSYFATLTYKTKTSQRISIALFAESAESGKLWARNLVEALKKREQAAQRQKVRRVSRS
jgi:hypothetical protein